MQKLLKRLKSQGAKRVILYGVTELAEIAYLSLHVTKIERAAVLKIFISEKKFFDHTVQPNYQLRSIRRDRIIPTSTKPLGALKNNLEEQGFPQDRVVIVN